MIVLGISAYYHDSAAAIVRDGIIVNAAQEERFTDDNTTPYILDFVHLNEAGNRIAAEHVAPIVTARQP